MIPSHRLSIPRRTLLGLCAGIAATTALSACAPPGGAGDGSAADAPTSVSTDLGSEPITLVLYDGAGLKDVDDALIAAFTEQHPNITIETRFDPDNVQAINAPRVLSSDNPPDLARIVALSDIVQANLLTPLTPWAGAYGWSDIPEGQLAQYTVDDSGVRGSGTQYTVASGFTMTGVYYNKELLSSLGIQETPTTIDEFEAALAAAKAAGHTPIMAGNATGQVATTMQFLLNTYMGADAVNGWVFHEADASVDTPEALQAAEKLTEWAQAGYFPADVNGIDNTQALGQFTSGGSLFYASGNWDAAALETAMGDNVGFFAPPSVDGESVAAMSDPLTNFAIPAKAANKDAAAAFLDFLMSDEAHAIVVENGFAPSGGETGSHGSGVKAEVQSAFAELVAADGQVQFIQNATNGSTAEWNSQLQLLVAGNTTPAEMLAAVQAKYETEVG